MKSPKPIFDMLTSQSNKVFVFLLVSASLLWIVLKTYQHNGYAESFADLSSSQEQELKPDKRPLVFMGIYSDDEYRERRDTLRITWLETIKKMADDLPFRIVHKFFLDKNTTATDEENNLYQDMMFFNVPEHGYAKKFGRKMYHLLKYIHQNYPQADLGIRIDDDVFLCVPQIFKRLNELKSPNLYYGWRHGEMDVIKPSVWIDEMFLVLGKNVIKWVANKTFCVSSKCDKNTLRDTDYGDTSLRNWITGYKDIDFHSDNGRIKQIHIPADDKNWMKYATLEYCENNVVFHKVKISRFMKKMHKNNEILKAKTSKVGSVSGTAFSGQVERVHLKDKPFNSQKIARPIRKTYKCSYWAVVTTIFKPSTAVRHIASLTDWCLVIVADLETPSKREYTSLLGTKIDNKIKYLSLSEQMDLYPLLTEFIPLSSFSRKNIGYMYAIHHKADLIWDFDDDNIGIIDDILFRNTNDYMSACVKKTENVLVNPYPYFSQSNIRLWPRGFPLDSLKSKNTSPDLCRETTKKKLGVIQSLANGEADVDAIYRLTYDFPFNFTAKQGVEKLFVLPTYTYTPFNAQATLWFPAAFQYLALPISVNGRVSDIWRSYIAEHFFHKSKMTVAFSPPYVFHNRTEHNIMGDFHAETPLYEQSSKLIELLSSNSYTDIVSMYDDLYRRLYIEKEDLHFIRAWVKTFQFVKKSIA